MKNLMPGFIIEQFKQENFKGSFNAFVMIVDISGFTRLTETLMLHKKHGAEVLTNVINGIFEPIIEKIYQQNGMVSSFAGDSFTAIFRETNVNGENSINQIISTALFVQDLFSKNISTLFAPSVDLNMEIGVRIGLSFGQIEWGILGKAGKHTYYYKGKAIRNCVKSEKHAVSGSIVVDSRIIELNLIDDRKITLEKISDGYFSLESIESAPGLQATKLVENTKLSRSELEPFIFDSVLDFKGKAEFREVVSVFISFREPETEKEMNDFVTGVIEKAYNYGGFFNKLDFGDKGKVALVLFGAPKSYENNIKRALNFILNLQQSSILDFRAGISYGTVYAGIMGSARRCEYTVIGDTVNFSSRLMTGAKWNEIRVSEVISVKQNQLFEFKKLGDFKYKGTTKVATYQLLCRKDKQIDRFFESEFIGREIELQQLKQFTEPVFQKKSAGVTYIYGEAGQGKSRLVWEFRKRIVSDNKARQNMKRISWFFMPSEEIFRKSFNCVNYFLNNYFNISEENSEALNARNFKTIHNELISKLHKIRNSCHLSQDSTTLAEIMKELDRSKSILAGYLGIKYENSLFDQLDGKGRYENYLYAVKELIKAESLINPVIIELEDAHWLDEDSKEFLKILTRNIENFPVQILCLVRYNDDGSKYSLDLSNTVKTNSLDLNVFSRKNISDYSRMVLKTERFLSEELQNYIYEKTDGNPFFMEQILLYLKELDLFQLDKNKNLFFDMKEIEKIPSSIQAVVISRLDRLSHEMKQVVQTASVLGREFYIRILSQILGNDKQFQTIFKNNLRDIEQEKIWMPISQISYIFKHALLRDSAYGMQLQSKLVQLHKYAAFSYEEVFKLNLKDYYGDLAYHHEKSENIDKAIYYLEKAGDHASKHYRNDSALKYYEQAIANLNSYTEGIEDSINVSEKLIDIHLKKGEVLQLIGKWDKALFDFKIAVGLAEEINDNNRLAQAEGKTGWQLCLQGNHSEALSCYEKQLKICKDLEDMAGIAVASGGIGQVYWKTNQYEKAMVNFEHQLEISKSLDNSSEISKAYGNIGNIHKNKGNYSEAMLCYQTQLRINEKNKDKQGMSFALVNIGRVYEDKGDSKKALEYFTKMLDLAKEIGDKRFISFAMGNIGIIYNFLSDFENTLKCYEEQYRISVELGDKNGMAMSLGNTGNTYYLQGNYSRAVQYFTETLQLYRELKNKRGISIANGLIGVISRKKGEYSKAIQYFNSKLDTCEELGDKLGLSNALGYLGDVYFSKKQLTKSLDYYLHALLIDDKIDSKPLTINHLLGKANCLFFMGQYKESRFCIDSIQSIALELDDQHYVFMSKVMEEKINYKTSESVTKKKQCIDNLIFMLSEEMEEDRLIELNYEISIMQNQLNISYAINYRQKTINLLKEQFEKTPDVRHLNRIEELQKQNSGDL